jgi:hypothetical protein
LESRLNNIEKVLNINSSDNGLGDHINDNTTIGQLVDYINQLEQNIAQIYGYLDLAFLEIQELQNTTAALK